MQNKVIKDQLITSTGLSLVLSTSKHNADENVTHITRIMSILMHNKVHLFWRQKAVKRL